MSSSLAGGTSAARWLHAAAHPGARAWLVAAWLEAGAGAYVWARLAFGPLSETGDPALWLAATLLFSLAYFALSLAAVQPLLAARAAHGTGAKAGGALWASSLPLLAIFVLGLLFLQFGPDPRTSPIGSIVAAHQPLPVVAFTTLYLVILAVKLLAVPAEVGNQIGRNRLSALNPDIVLPASMLGIGILQSSMYVVPIGNAFGRFWAIADAVAIGGSYPVTLTESGPVAAGSPPYVYDLGLFPLMLLASFSAFGHNSAAGHLPAALFSVMFPLSLYLLVKQVTGSRLTATLFASLTALFPYLRLWVLNLPDPDPVLLTTLCLAGYFYLRALASPRRSSAFAIAGAVTAVLSLARPEGILYAGCLGLGLLASRPRLKQFLLFAAPVAISVGTMIAVWWTNFGFLWPENYNRTLSLDHPLRNYQILRGNMSLDFYWRGLGLDEPWALGLILLFTLSVLAGTLLMAFKDRLMLALTVPAIGNTVLILFAHPSIPNSYHYADFFRHASFGIPLLVMTSAYLFHHVYRALVSTPRLRALGYLCVALLVVAVVREGDILANPTETHRPGATQVLPSYTHLPMESILRHPLELPVMSYYHDGKVTVAEVVGMDWPEDGLSFFEPFDITHEAGARPYGYVSVLLFLLALPLAFLAEGPSGARRPEAATPVALASGAAYNSEVPQPSGRGSID